MFGVSAEKREGNLAEHQQDQSRLEFEFELGKTERTKEDMCAKIRQLECAVLKNADQAKKAEDRQTKDATDIQWLKQRKEFAEEREKELKRACEEKDLLLAAKGKESDQLLSEREKLNGRIAETEADRKESHAQLAERETECAKLRKEGEQLSSQLMESRKMAEQREQLLNAERCENRTRLAERDKEYAQLRKERDELSSRLTEIRIMADQRDLDTAKQQQTAYDSLEKKERECAQLLERQDQLKDDVKEMKRMSKEREITQERKLVEISSLLDTKERECAKLSEERREWNNQIAELRRQERQKEESLKTVQKKRRALESSLTEKNRATSQLQKERDQLTDKVKRMEKMAENKELSWKAEEAGMRRSLRDMKYERDQHLEERNKRDTLVTEIRKEANQTERDLIKQKVSLALLEDKKKEFLELQENQDELNKQLEVAEERELAFRQKQTELSTELKGKENECDWLVKDRDRLNDQIMEMEQRAEEKGRAFREEQSSFQTLLKERHQQIANIRKGAEQRERSLVEELAEIYASLEGKQMDCALLLEEKDQLNGCIEQLRQTAEETERNLRSELREIHDSLGRKEAELELLNDEIVRIRRFAEESERNLQKYEDVLQIPSTEVEMTDIRLGSGAYGEVSVAYCRGSLVAVKKFHQTIAVGCNIGLFKQEIGVGSRVRHPNVISLFGVTIENGIPIQAITELLEGSVSDVMKAVSISKCPLSLREKTDLTVDSSAGTAYLHRLGILHGDIRSSNIVVTPMMVAKVCDFGSARFAEASLSAGPLSPDYLAPERETGNDVRQHNTKEADVYSLGVTVIEVMTGLLAAADLRHNHLGLIDHQFVQRLCLRAIDDDPRKRPGAREFLADLKTVQQAEEYKKCLPKRMVKGKRYGGSVRLVEGPWM